MKIAVIATHPIQYQVPLWAELSALPGVKVSVYYASKHGLDEGHDPLYGKSFSWNIPLLDGYDYKFLKSRKIPILPDPTANLFPTGLIKELKKNPADVLLVHGYMNGAFLAAFLASKKLRIPIYMRSDSHLVGRDLDCIKERVKKLTLPILLRNISGFFAIGEWNKQYWLHYGVPANRIKTTLFSIDNDRFRNTLENGISKVANLKDKCGLVGKKRIFVYCGNLQKHKGIDLLLKAFAKVRSQENEVGLLIIGDGPERHLVENKTVEKDGLCWVGFVNQNELPYYLAVGDLFVLPSRTEPWGLVVNEALASGLPCIVSSIAGCSVDLIVKSGGGSVFNAGKESELADTMTRALDDNIFNSWCMQAGGALQQANPKQNAKDIVEWLRASR